MRQVVLVPVALLALVALAGCTGGEAPVVAATTSSGPPADARVLAPPAWQVGDWWNYTLRAGGEGAFTLAVAADAGNAYILDTDSRSTAFYNAVEDVSYLGPIRKSDLAGSQGPERVEFLRWPLHLGSNWTTAWDGMTVRIQVERETRDGRYELSARRPDGTLHATYTYSPQAGWMSSFAFHDGSGAPVFAFELADTGRGYNGTLHRYQLEHAVQWGGDLRGANGFTTFAVEPTVTDVYYRFNVTCSSGAYVATGGRLVVFDRTGFNSESPCPATDTWEGAMPRGVGNATETWGAQVYAPDATVGSYAYDVWKRTLVSFRVDEAPPA